MAHAVSKLSSPTHRISKFFIRTTRIKHTKPFPRCNKPSKRSSKPAVSPTSPWGHQKPSVAALQFYMSWVISPADTPALLAAKVERFANYVHEPDHPPSGCQGRSFEDIPVKELEGVHKEIFRRMMVAIMMD